MRSLFDPRTGDGLSYLRQPIGASDFVATRDYTYDDLPAGQADYRQRHFSIAHDEAKILPLLRRAKRLNQQLQMVASPWSPPAWMKTNDSLVGGRLIDSPRIYRSYAQYLTKFVQAYRARGVRVDTITVQNEPQNRAPSGYPGTDIPGTAYHCYFGDPSAMSALHAQYPDKDIYLTECSGSQSSDPANTFSDTLKWHSRNLIIGSPRNWAKTVINWNVALDPSRRPARRRL